MQRRISAILVFLIISYSSIAQSGTHYVLDTSVVVVRNGDSLLMPMCGGFNSPVFCRIDLNGDSFNDLLVLDRVGNRISTFLFNANAVMKYEYAPSYISKIPPLHDWVSSYDFDCDGDLDLMTYFNNSIGIWENDFTINSGLSFSLYTSQINSQYASGVSPIFSTQVNLSAFDDVDNDGDMDILTFTNSGNFIEFHKNYSMDSLGVCNQLLYKVEPDCWGHFRLSGLTNTALLNQNCVTNRESHLHSGSVLTVLDEDCDGDADIINGDILGSNLLFLKNGGTPDSALIVQQDTVFPSYNVNVNLQNLPAAFYLDADGDSINDLLVTPFATVGEDLRNVHFYKNIGSNCQNVFSFVKNNFMIDEMIDVGTSANVSFFDVNGDGRKDLVIGNDYAYNANPNLQYSTLSVYLNTSVGAVTSFEFLTSDWLNLSSLGQFGLSPAFGDIDGDGDDDLILGNADGSLIYYKNNSVGSSANFVFAGPYFQSIDVGNNSIPQIIDVDRDGKNDLLIGERSGVLNFYKNNSVGSTLTFNLVSANFGNVNVTSPNSITGYSSPVMFDNGNGYELLVGCEKGTIFHYQNIDNNLTGAFTLVDSMYEQIYEPKRATLAIADYNQDGINDLLIGNGAGGIRGYLGQLNNGVLETQTSDLYFDVSPNPLISENVLFLKFKAPIKNAKLELIDVLGKIVWSCDINEDYKQIDTSKMQLGTYLLSVKQGERIYSKKIIKL
ncbi:MAG: T9SS type A sorting domain-containing protein [Bacteroidota bacterium]